MNKTIHQFLSVDLMFLGGVAISHFSDISERNILTRFANDEGFRLFLEVRGKTYIVASAIAEG